jgi:hypothetical protein
LDPEEVEPLAVGLSGEVADVREIVGGRGELDAESYGHIGEQRVDASGYFLATSDLSPGHK